MGYCFQFYYLLSKENLIAKDGESEIEKLYRSNTEEEGKISHNLNRIRCATYTSSTVS